VKAATKLTGMELRQFSEAGVPLLDALVKQANAAGGAWVTVGGGAKKTKVDLKETADQLGIANQKLKEWTAGGKHSESSMMSLKNRIENLNEKISSNAGTTEGTRKVWQKTTVTAQQMIEKISDGEVSFDQVQKALSGMTEKGGKFFNLMDTQSKTFGGITSNIADQFTRITLGVIGFDMAANSPTFGQIKDGTLFMGLKNAAEAVLTFLNAHQLDIANFFMGIVVGVTAAYQTVTSMVGPMVEWFQKNRDAIEAVASVIAFALLPQMVLQATQLAKNIGLWAIHKTVALLGNIQTTYMLITGGWQLVAMMIAKAAQIVWTTGVWIVYNTVTTITDILTGRLTISMIAQKAALVAGMLATQAITAAQWLWNIAMDANPIGLVIIGVAALAAGLLWATGHWGDFRKAAVDAIEVVLGWVKKLLDWIGKIKIPGIGELSKVKIPGFAEGVQNFSGGLAVVGERGPELVNLPRGSNVTPNNQMGNAAGKQVTINQTNNIYGEVDMDHQLRKLAYTVATS
jgi:hypothetical protein